ncbi:MAG TPA: bifunctional oligoribonuclease/PAP phosphatase NrnA [Anaerolineae bacterium]|nr:bifunctional oligoribonuclease/PAP phosphatase NrnA [Anaerolineae bacterium]
MSNKVMDKIGEVFAAARNVLVLTHISPDGDAFGSMTAVGSVMRALGKNVTLVVEDGMNDEFAYLPLADKVKKRLPYDGDYDLLIAVDCGDEERMGEPYLEVQDRPIIVNIDHHITNTGFGRFNLVPSSTSSACEVLYTLFDHLNYEISQDVAISLLTGIVTDTLCFRTSSVKPETLSIASALIKAGADLPSIVSRALVVKPFASLKIWREGLNKMKLEAGVAWTTLSFKDLDKPSFDGGSNAGLASMFSNVKEAACGAVLREKEDGRVVVSLRSRPPFSVAEVAVELGGGGHAQASGCALDLPLEEAEFEVVRRLKASVAAQKAALLKK